MLNNCSCYLNLGQLDLCANECTEVLATDVSNRKALYRRGQAYNGLYRYTEAVKDLTKALEMSPANEKEVVASKLKEAQEGAARQPAAEKAIPVVRSQPTSDQVSQADQPSERSNGAASSSSQTEKITVQDGHISDADSDTVEEILPAQPQAARQTAMGGAPMGVPPMSMPPGVDPEQMRSMMQDPNMMRTMADMMSNIDPAQLESMAKMSGAPAGMQISPDMLKSVSSMMSSMSPEMMQSMMAMAGGSAAGAAPTAGNAATASQQPAPGHMPAGGPQISPQMMDQMQKHLSDPATADLISAFTQSMKPEDLAGMLKQGGMDVTTEQAAQYLKYAKKISPRNMRLLMKAAGYGVPLFTMAKQSKQFIQQHPLLFWAALILLLGLFLRYLGWV